MKPELIGTDTVDKRATREALGTTLIELFDDGMPISVVEADLSGSTTTAKFEAHSEETAKRFFNAGIAEQNMIDVAAGLSLTGNIAFTGSFAVFGTGRVYDQIRNTVCYSNLNVKLCPTHAGISVGPDGGSHQMLEDIALMRPLPNMRILVPSDYESAVAAIKIAAKEDGPFYVRLGRAAVPAVYKSDNGFELGKAYVIREGSDVSIIACGIEVAEALKAADELSKQGIEAEVIDAFSIKPLDEEAILSSISKTGCAVTAEEHSLCGGLGEAVSRLVIQNDPVPVECVGMENRFGKSGSLDELIHLFGLDSASIVEAVQKVREKMALR